MTDQTEPTEVKRNPEDRVKHPRRRSNVFGSRRDSEVSVWTHWIKPVIEVILVSLVVASLIYIVKTSAVGDARQDAFYTQCALSGASVYQSEDYLVCVRGVVTSITRFGGVTEPNESDVRSTCIRDGYLDLRRSNYPHVVFCVNGIVTGVLAD